MMKKHFHQLGLRRLTRRRCWQRQTTLSLSSTQQLLPEQRQPPIRRLSSVPYQKSIGVSTKQLRTNDFIQTTRSSTRHQQYYYRRHRSPLLLSSSCLLSSPSETFLLPTKNAFLQKRNQALLFSSSPSTNFDGKQQTAYSAPGDEDLETVITEDALDEKLDGTKNEWLADVKSNALNYGVYAIGGTAAFYTVYRSLMYVANTFMGITFTDVAWFGFLSGCVSTTIATAAVYTLYDFFRIRPERVFRTAYTELCKNSNVKEKLGPLWTKTIVPSEVKAYKIDGGGFNTGDGSRGVKLVPGTNLVWRYPRVQMLFLVKGSKASGIVTVEALKKWNAIHMNLLTVDPVVSVQVDGVEKMRRSEGGDSAMIHVKGEVSRLYVRKDLQDLIFFGSH